MRIFHGSQTAAQLISSYQYTYDANSNRLTQDETHRDIPLGNGGQAETTTYVYDHLYRLTSVTYGAGGVSGALVHTYAPNGNRLTEQGTDPTDPSKPINRTYTYDRINRLLGVTDNLTPSNSVVHDYDANGNRTTMTVGGVTIPYFTISTISS